MAQRHISFNINSPLYNRIIQSEHFTYIALTLSNLKVFDVIGLM